MPQPPLTIPDGRPTLEQPRPVQLGPEAPPGGRKRQMLPFQIQISDAFKIMDNGQHHRAHPIMSVPAGKIFMIEHFSAEVTFNVSTDKLLFVMLGTELSQKPVVHQFTFASLPQLRVIVNQPVRAYGSPGTTVFVTSWADITVTKSVPPKLLVNLVGQLLDP
jgi:hypothetical protein